MNFDLCREIQQPVMTKVGVSLCSAMFSYLIAHGRKMSGLKNANRWYTSTVGYMEHEDEDKGAYSTSATFYGHLAKLVSLAVYHLQARRSYVQFPMRSLDFFQLT
jgi:hypothetical protein